MSFRSHVSSKKLQEYASENPYGVLGIQCGATEETVRYAYWLLRKNEVEKAKARASVLSGIGGGRNHLNWDEWARICLAYDNIQSLDHMHIDGPSENLELIKTKKHLKKSEVKNEYPFGSYYLQKYGWNVGKGVGAHLQGRQAFVEIPPEFKRHFSQNRTEEFKEIEYSDFKKEGAIRCYKCGSWQHQFCQNRLPRSAK